MMSIIKKETDRVIVKLKTLHGQYSKISRSVDVSAETMSKLARNEVINPRISTIDALHDYLFESVDAYQHEEQERVA